MICSTGLSMGRASIGLPRVLTTGTIAPCGSTDVAAKPLSKITAEGKRNICPLYREGIPKLLVGVSAHDFKCEVEHAQVSGR